MKTCMKKITFASVSPKKSKLSKHFLLKKQTLYPDLTLNPNGLSTTARLLKPATRTIFKRIAQQKAKKHTVGNSQLKKAGQTTPSAGSEIKSNPAITFSFLTPENSLQDINAACNAMDIKFSSSLSAEILHTRIQNAIITTTTDLAQAVEAIALAERLVDEAAIDMASYCLPITKAGLTQHMEKIYAAKVPVQSLTEEYVKLLINSNQQLPEKFWGALPEFLAELPSVILTTPSLFVRCLTLAMGVACFFYKRSHKKGK